VLNDSFLGGISFIQKPKSEWIFVGRKKIDGVGVSFLAQQFQTRNSIVIKNKYLLGETVPFEEISKFCKSRIFFNYIF
jgi:hypothetical protein